MRPRRALALLALCVVLTLGGFSTECTADDRAGRAIRRSDVVFMYDNQQLYETYGCTVLGWAGRTDRDWIERAHAGGVRLFSGSVGFLTESRKVIDFSDDFLDAACRNFAGEPFLVPWLVDEKHQYKGHGAYWWCTNSPLYREYLDHRLREVIAAGVDGLHIDDYRGTSGCVTWLGGCFCRHCTLAFREYLAENVSEDRLAELGIDDLASFDYRRFLTGRGITAEQYNKRRGGLPLAEEFYEFQVKADNDFVARYYAKAKRLAERELTLCVNSGLTNAHSLMIAPHLSYFCCEVRHNASGRAVAEHPVYVYKLADGLNRPVASTAAGSDWAYIYEHNLPGLVRTWVALSYAHGHTLMAPHRQWCHTAEKGTHWYAGPTEEYAHVYQFVGSIGRLLDGYEAVAPVAVVYDNAARRKGLGDIEPIAIELAGRNVPFTVVVAGDDWLDYRLDGERLSQFTAVVVGKDLAMNPKQQELINRVERQGRLIVWPDVGRLDELVGHPVRVEGSDQVCVVPRWNPGNEYSPAVIHLLNRAYDGDRDACVAQRDFKVQLRNDLFGARKPVEATLHTPGRPSQSLRVTSGSSATTIDVPELADWAIVELTGE